MLGIKSDRSPIRGKYAEKLREMLKDTDPKSSFELFGVECGNGWKSLYQPLVDWVEKYNSEHEDKIEIRQIKEKFGGLRFYVSSYPDELFDLIGKAEEESYRVCEFCGTRENVGLTVGGWYTTICLDCLQKSLKERNIKPFDKWRRNSDKKVFIVFPDSVEEVEE